MTEISYPVPATTTSLFLVIADQPGREHAGPQRDVAGLNITVWPAADSPLDPTRVWAYANWDGPLPPPSACHYLVSATAPTWTQPRSAQVARAYARRLAATAGGLLIVWMTRDVVLGAARPERAQVHLGDQWLGFDFHVYDDRHKGIPERDPWSEWPRPEDACVAIRLQTLGLARFGLPEVVIDGVDCAYRLPALNVLRAVGQRLLTEHWTFLGTATDEATPGTERRISARQRIPGGAFAAYWGASLPGGDAFTVSLTASERLLRVEEPRGRRLNEWLAHARSNLQSVAAWPPDDFDAYTQLEPPATPFRD